MIDAVVLDIGNVLIGWDPEGFYDRRIGKERRRRLFAEVPLHEMNLRIDGGAPFAPTVDGVAAAHPGWAAEIRLWHDAWLEMTAPDKPQSVALMRAVRSKGVPVWALTNFGTETLALAEGAYPFLREFDRRFVSAEIGICKPEPGIYAVVEAQGVPRARLLYTDDSAANVAAAAERGWATHHFTGEAGWAARLIEEGILTEAEAA